MIEYDVLRHENGKIRITEDINGRKRFVNKGKRKFFDDEEAAEILRDKHRSNERKAKLWLNNKRSNVNI